MLNFYIEIDNTFMDSKNQNFLETKLGETIPGRLKDVDNPLKGGREELST